MKTLPTELDARLLFNQVETLGPIRMGALLERFGSIRSAWEAGAGAWRGVEGFGERAAEYFRRVESSFPAYEKERQAMDRLNIRPLCALDAEYPEVLRHLRDAPMILYVRGSLTLEDQAGVGLVGSRRASPYGMAVAERLGRELAEAGVTVVSGLARGIDAAAHTAALNAGGRTVGFLGSGLGRFYPPENRRLADQMADHGAVVSEFSLGTEPDAMNFPRRNRLISGLSAGVVVVEAMEKSGALITASCAAEQGREVFAVPGSIFSPLSRGAHRLIRDGATPVQSAMDILEGLQVFRGGTRKPPSAAAPAGSMEKDISTSAGRLLSALSLDPRGIDGLARVAGLSAAEVSRELLSLELAGWVRAVAGKQYVRTEKTFS